jgi:hypothetical protein
MKCKNCEVNRVTNDEGFCFDCVDEFFDDGHQCKTSSCNKQVLKKGEYCFECREAILEDKRDAEREERYFEKYENGQLF